MDESDKELIRVAREDLEDDEPKEKSHKEKKRSTEGKTDWAVKRISPTQNVHSKTIDFALFIVNLVINKRAKRAAEEGTFDWLSVHMLTFFQGRNFAKIAVCVFLTSSNLSRMTSSEYKNIFWSHLHC